MKKKTFLILGVMCSVILGICHQEKERDGEFILEDGKMIFAKALHRFI